MFNNTFSGKTVVITGHTGFKGSWLSMWLMKLGARVVGISSGIPSDPSHYEVSGLKQQLGGLFTDIRDLESLVEIFQKEKPDYVFHLAAQAIVSESYRAPVDTFSTNVLGTVNVLEAIRVTMDRCVAIVITSDKCYENVEWVWGYRETDRLGGKDIYSGSKGAAELAISSYINSFFNRRSGIRVGICRAGNVIGGGDWARDRIVVDCIRSWSRGEKVKIRNPDATRPWQHVLEPLSGYLLLAKSLTESGQLHGEAFNFGPENCESVPVVQLLHDLALEWGFNDPTESYEVTGETHFKEAGLLRLNCDKALFHLGWRPNLEYSEMVRFVGEWYREFYMRKDSTACLSRQQISQYEELGKARKRVWVQ